MSWQKIARFAIAVFVIGFGGFVFLAMRQRTAPAAGNEVVRADPEAVRRNWSRRAQELQGRQAWKRDSWSQALAYKDGRTKLLDVTLMSRIATAARLWSQATKGEAQSPPDKPDEVSVA